MVARVLVIVALVLVLGVPFLFRPSEATPPADALRLVIVTPHNEQIRHEFSLAFDAWHRERYGEPVVIDWRQPGGTSEIRRMLTAIYTKAVRSGRISADGEVDGTMPFDLLFGGGSYEFGKVKEGVTARPPGSEEAVTVAVSRPIGWSEERLRAIYGENRVGRETLYDPDGHWLGTALSGFGIVFNRDVLDRLGLDDPTSWYDMTDPRLIGWVALADPRMSGSVTTTYDSILNTYGWDEGWRILRSMCGNARYFANGSKKVPLDVTQGEAAMGVSIDFYGRYQSQAVREEGESAEESRVGYVDPPGAVYIDPDPIALLRGAPSPGLAERFVEFVLSDEGQALWQFPAGEGGELGPREYELRRMPVRRDFYEAYGDRMIDDVDPYDAASDDPYRGWRGSIALLMSASSIDIHDEQVAAWRAIRSARERGVEGSVIAEAERLFFAMPVHELPDGREVRIDASTYDAVSSDWKRLRREGGYEAVRIGYTAFFRANYRRIVEMLEEAESARGAA